MAAANVATIVPVVMCQGTTAGHCTRRELGWSWLVVGLAVVMLLLRLMIPASIPTLGASGEAVAVQHAPQAHAPHDLQCAAQQSHALLGESESEDEDASPNVDPVAARRVFELPADPDVRWREPMIEIQGGHLLISTGLGRGPPIG